jgi:hypothetical protein
MSASMVYFFVKIKDDVVKQKICVTLKPTFLIVADRRRRPQQAAMKDNSGKQESKWQNRTRMI